MAHLHCAAHAQPATGAGPVEEAAAEGSGRAEVVTGSAPPDEEGRAKAGNLEAARLLEQAAFGPSPVDLARVRHLGIEAWLAEQFSLPESGIANPGGLGSGLVQAQYLSRLSQAPDQLRQRVAYALSQIMVISLNKNLYPDEIVPYLQLLSRHAFGSYRTLLGEIATSSQMGKYLDLANSRKPTPGSAANENFARELMQLFTIGLYLLEPDGTVRLDPLGHPVRAYDQATVQQVALALTGWTFPGPGSSNWESFSGPLLACEEHHDAREKTLDGAILPAGLTAPAEMAATLDWLFQHPNAGPFLATRLIRSLVVSNPSPGYVQRVARVFSDNGAGVRGDLRAVITAILMDAEARGVTPAANGGRLKDATYHMVAFVRALGGTIPAVNSLSWQLGQLGQRPLAPPSVFGFYSPYFRVPRSSLAGPEFQIYGPTEAVLRGNLFWRILSDPGPDVVVDITPFLTVAGDPMALVEAVDRTLLYGRMPAAMRESLARAIVAQPDDRTRALTALYLASLSGFYAVQY